MIVLLISVVSCKQQPPPALQTIAVSRTVDLSHVVREDIPYRPGEPLTQIEYPPGTTTPSELRIGLHSGTSLRVAAQSGVAQTTVDQLSPQELVVPAVVIDVRDAAQDVPGYQLSANDVQAWERQHGRIPAGALVLAATGWDVRWGDPAAYLSLTESGPQAPRFADDAVALLRKRDVRGLGIDSVTTTDNDLADQWLQLENLTNLEQLPPTGTTLMIGALKVQASPSSPARVLALVP